MLGWLRDVRRFAPADLGFEWLMKLAARSEPRYHDFAVETMIKLLRAGRLRSPGEPPGLSRRLGRQG